jgi:hypothetical protein
MPKAININDPKLQAITKVFADHGLAPPIENVDWWNCHGDVVLKHNGCQKLAFSVGIRYLEPQWLVTGQNGVWAVMISGYLPDKPEDIIFTHGESSPQNNKNQYPVAMADKRGKDRLTLRLLKLAKHGILSEVEAEEKEHALASKNDEIAKQKKIANDLKGEVKKLQNKLKEEPSKEERKTGPRAFNQTKPAPELVKLPDEGMSPTVWANWLKIAGLESSLFPSIKVDDAKCSVEKLAELFNSYIQSNRPLAWLLRALKEAEAENPRQLKDSEAEKIIKQLKESA